MNCTMNLKRINTKERKTIDEKGFSLIFLMSAFIFLFTPQTQAATQVYQKVA
ncbi:hypothetical protein A21D_00762 [Virgibacillus dokdonensis]|uniref:Uncharacterized protein n=1 Tax=Virgibacillus dokdonensis TaxID=302167 RepID=A0A2K9IWR6_9BACI|nr:hypothetical protein A21D_00762 [Virgibacillus dokdonensis]